MDKTTGSREKQVNSGFSLALVILIARIFESCVSKVRMTITETVLKKRTDLLPCMSSCLQAPTLEVLIKGQLGIRVQTRD